MKFTKFEQSGFLFETDAGFRLALDIANKTTVDELAGVSCDAMLVSHIHGDHFSLEQIRAVQPKKLYLNHECRETLGEEILPFEIVQIEAGQTIHIDSITIQIFNVDHGPNVSAPLAENFGFLISADNTTYYFAGDMYYSSGIDVSELEVDFALLPVGTHYTFGPEEALVFAKEFKKIGTIVPMHYENKRETCGQFVTIAEVAGFPIWKQ